MSAFLHLLDELGESKDVTDPLSEALELAISRFYEQTKKPICRVINKPPSERISKRQKATAEDREMNVDR